MSDTVAGGILELSSSEENAAPKRSILLLESPFMVGRGEQGNHLALADARLSRKCASIAFERGRYYVEDRGNALGLFLNGGRVTRQVLEDGDVITFGPGIPYNLTFRFSAGSSSIENLVTRIGGHAETDAAGGLEKLSLLLEATRLLHSHLPLETVLESMLDRAIAVTDADRALLLENDKAGGLQRRLARRAGNKALPPAMLTPSQTAVNTAIERRSAVITQDLDQAEGALQSARSIVDQRLLAVVAIPLYAKPRARQASSDGADQHGLFLGVMYLDSQRRAAFSNLDRQILDAIAIESASIIDNARLVRLEQEQQRVEQELNIARGIQQALLPRGLRDFPHVSITGMNTPCHEVGGDYFDILPVGEDRVAFLIADVSGKGLGAALLTTMLQGAFSGTKTGSQPERVFEHINDLLCERSDVGRHATMFFATLDRAGNLDYINAGHPSPLLIHDGKAHELFEAGSLPIGLIPAVQYPVTKVKLDPGDTLVLFSDGITEAEDRNGEFFGDARLRDSLEEQQDASLDAMQRNVFARVEQFTKGAEQADDITVLFVRYRIPV